MPSWMSRAMRLRSSRLANWRSVPKSRPACRVGAIRRVTSRAIRRSLSVNGRPSGRSATTTVVDPLPRAKGTTRARRRPSSSTKETSVGTQLAGLVRSRSATCSAMCHGARVEPRRATGTRCSASWVTSTALRVDGTSAESRSRASVALAGASRPVDIWPDRSCRRWISSIASRAAGSARSPSCSAVSRWFQAPSTPRVSAAPSQAMKPTPIPLLVGDSKTARRYDPQARMMHSRNPNRPYLEPAW